MAQKFLLKCASCVVRRSYVLWREYIAPVIALEFASGDGSEERDKTPLSRSETRESGKPGKFWVYEQVMRIPYYGIYLIVIAGERNTCRHYSGSEDDNNTVKAVSSDPDALGYFGFAYFEENQDKLKAVAIDGGTGKGAIVPTREAVEQAQYQPLSRPLFIYINLQKSQEKPELRQLVIFYLNNVE